MNLKKITPLFLGLGVAIITTSCGEGQNSIVKDVNVITYEQDSDGYVEFNAILGSGAMRFPIFDIPIKNPDNPNVEYGRIWMYDVVPSGSQLGVTVNVTAASGTPFVDATLPNGSRLPIAGIEDAVVLAVPVSVNNIKVYAAFAPNVALLGAAIPISEFDKVGQSACPISLLPSFKIANGIRGIAGVFTGCEPGQSGVAIFVDAGQKLFPTDPPANEEGAATRVALQNVMHDMMVSDMGNTPAMLLPQALDYEKDKKVRKALYKLNKSKKGKRLHLN